jgi:predicted MFS family arabinose efflux permease
VSNLARIYRIAPGAESRGNTLYMVAYFSGASAGSAAGAQAWARWNWPGVCALGVILVAAALAVHLFWRSEDAPRTAPVRPRR